MDHRSNKFKIMPKPKTPLPPIILKISDKNNCYALSIYASSYQSFVTPGRKDKKLNKSDTIRLITATKYSNKSKKKCNPPPKKAV